MNPRGGVLGQSLGGGTALIALATLSTIYTRWAVSILAAATLANAALLAGKYVLDLRGEDAVARSPYRILGDRLVLVETAWVIVAPLAVVAIARQHNLATWLQVARTEVTILLTALSVVVVATFNSSLWDWLYIRPRRDGLVWEPPCRSADHERWHRVTKTWLRHRFVAELVFAASVPITGTLIFFALTSEVAGWKSWVTRIVGITFTVGGLAIRYSWKRLQVGAWSVNRARLPFRLGQTIDWSVPGEAKPDAQVPKRFSFLGWAHLQLGKDPLRQPLPPWTGARRYVLDVALDDARVIFAAGTPTEAGYPEDSLPMAELVKRGAITDARRLSYCRAGNKRSCRAFHDMCERDPTRRDPGPAPTTTPLLGHDGSRRMT